MSNPPKKKDHQNSKGALSSLSPEDADLWQQVISSVKPLEKRHTINEMDDTPFMQHLRKQSQNARQKNEDLSYEERFSGHISGAIPQNAEQKQASKKTAPDLAKFDHKLFRKLGAERVEIEARLDLHGFRQDQAYSALKNFLRRAQVEGFRHVLVITGKGAPKHLARDYELGEERPGVLKRLVPEWLGEDELRDFVVSYTTAPVQHGGEGALYVKVRRGR